MLEVEVKVELMAPGPLRQRLRDVGAAPQGVEVQEDTYLLHPDRDLAEADEALRIRCVHRDGAGESWEITYKGPRRKGPVKVRQELNLAVDTDPAPLLEALGFRTFARLTKRRETWRLDDLTVCLDDVDDLGTFAEVEVVTKTESDTDSHTDPEADATARVEAAVERLGLVGATRHDASYLEMALAAGVVQAHE